MGLEYRLVPVSVDHAPADRGEPVTVAESGAILQYLPEEAGQFIGAVPGERGEVMQWLFWQMGGLGPIGGCYVTSAPSPSSSPPSLTTALRSIVVTGCSRASGGRWTSGSWPSHTSQALMQSLIWPAIQGPFIWPPADGIEAYPHVHRWRDALGPSPALQTAYARAAALDVGYERKDCGTALMPWDKIMKHVITV